MNELEQQIDELYCLYNDIKNEIRRKDKYLYERWKAGGFLIDEDIISGYPNLCECLTIIKDLEEKDYCVGCGQELISAYDDDPNGEKNCICAQCRAEENHDFDAEPDVEFDRQGNMIYNDDNDIPDKTYDKCYRKEMLGNENDR